MQGVLNPWVAVLRCPGFASKIWYDVKIGAARPKFGGFLVIFDNTFLVQQDDNQIFSKDNFKIVSRKKPYKSYIYSTSTWRDRGWRYAAN